jgi:hypothetical protein
MEVVRAEAEEVDEKAEVRCGEWSGPIRIGGGGEEKLAHVVSHRHSKHARAGAAASSSRPSMSHCLSSAAPPHRSSSIGATSYPPPLWPAGPTSASLAASVRATSSIRPKDGPRHSPRRRLPPPLDVTCLLPPIHLRHARHRPGAA